LKAIWKGKKYEDRFTQIWLVLWEDLASSHTFFTSPAYEEFHKVLQPAMNGRSIDWQCHAILNRGALDDVAHLKSILSSPAIEVAWTKVVEGGVAGYYKRFSEVVVPILNEEETCKGYFISPQIENPQDQMLLINWDSVDVRIVLVLYDTANLNEYRLIMKSLRRNQHSEHVLMHFSTIIRFSSYHGILWS
jgi:hypothetical protein